MCKPRVEMVHTGEWESWCREHPLPNGDTGPAFATWREALDHANEHAMIHQLREAGLDV